MAQPKMGMRKSSRFATNLNGTGRLREEHGDVEGALMVRHEKIRGRRDMLPAFNGNGDARDPKQDPRP